MGGLAFLTKGPFTMISGEDMAADRLVLISASTVIYADGGEEPIGITKEVVASGALVACEAMDGTIRKVTGSEAISVGAALYVATDGKVTDTENGVQIGIMIEAITGDGGKGAAFIWGPRGGNDVFATNAAKVYRIFDHFTSGATEDGNKFSETADKGVWFKSTTGSGADVCEVVDDGPGGIWQLTCNATNDDIESVQMNGSGVKLAVGTKVFFDTTIAIKDVDKCDWFVGLAIPDVAILAGVNDRVGFQCLHDGDIDCMVEEAANENLADTSVNATDCASIAVFATKKIRLSFLWDGVDTVYFYVNGLLTNTMVDDDGTITVPDGVVMTPVYEIITFTGAGAVQTMWIDYIDVQGEVA